MPTPPPEVNGNLQKNPLAGKTGTVRPLSGRKREPPHARVRRLPGEKNDSARPYSTSSWSKTWKPAFSMAQLASAALAGSAILSARIARSSVVEKQ